LTNISRDQAAKYGISQETYDALMNLFNKNESPAKFAEILKQTPNEVDGIGKLMLDNMPKS
jgi:hypothetical protein